MFGKTKTLESYEGRPLQGYSGNELQVVGQARVDVEYAQQKKQLPLFIVAGDQRPPGQGYIKSGISKFPSVFSKTIGTIKGYKLTFYYRKTRRYVS